MGKNSFSKVIDDRIDAYREAERDTYRQFMIDMFSVTLNDPDVMGKGVLGEDRLVKLLSAVGKNYDIYHEALEKSPLADVVQEKLDSKLKKIFKSHYDPFPVRYPWIIKPKY